MSITLNIQAFGEAAGTIDVVTDWTAKRLMEALCTLQGVPTFTMKRKGCKDRINKSDSRTLEEIGFGNQDTVIMYANVDRARQKELRKPFFYCPLTRPMISMGPTVHAHVNMASMRRQVRYLVASWGHGARRGAATTVVTHMETYISSLGLCLCFPV